MLKDTKMRFLATIVSFILMTNTLFGSDTILCYPVKSVNQLRKATIILPYKTEGELSKNKLVQFEGNFGQQLDDHFLSIINNNSASWEIDNHFCNSVTPLFSKVLFSSHRDLYEQLTFLQIPNSKEDLSNIELAVPPPGDCPLLEALAKDLADPDKGPALNAYLDELLTEGSVRVKAWVEVLTLKAHSSLRRDPTFLDDFAGVRPKYEKSGPMIGKEIGHTYSKHGSHNTNQLLYEAVNSGRPVSQWIDDIAAEDFIARHINQLGNGAKDIPIPSSVAKIGRIFKGGDGEIVKATHFRLVPSGNGVSTAYPINAALEGSMNPLGVFVP
jgi:hypothetical protein